MATLLGAAGVLVMFIAGTRIAHLALTVLLGASRSRGMLPFSLHTVRGILHPVTGNASPAQVCAALVESASRRGGSASAK